MKHLMIILLAFAPSIVVSGELSDVYPSAVIEAVEAYQEECTEEGGELELNGDEISKLWTDEGEQAYVIRAAFTCGSLGHLWCGAMGHCPTNLVINNKLYMTNKVLQQNVIRISKIPDGTVSYWLSDGLKLVTGR